MARKRQTGHKRLKIDSKVGELLMKVLLKKQNKQKQTYKISPKLTQWRQGKESSRGGRKQMKSQTTYNRIEQERTQDVPQPNKLFSCLLTLTLNPEYYWCLSFCLCIDCLKQWHECYIYVTAQRHRLSQWKTEAPQTWHDQWHHFFPHHQNC